LDLRNTRRANASAIRAGLSRLQLEINELIIAAPISDAQRDATVKAARAFATSGTPERDLTPAEPSQKPS